MNEQKLTFEFTSQQYSIIMSGLAKLPIEIGLETFEWMKDQAKQQLERAMTTTPSSPLVGKTFN